MQITFHQTVRSRLLLSVVCFAHIAIAARQPPVLVGTIYNQYNKPVKNADICLYRVNFLASDTTAGRQFPRGATRCRTTDRSGGYWLILPDRAPYVLLAHRKSAWVTHTIYPSADEDTIRVSDTLRPTGSLAFHVKTDQQSNHVATVALMGTPFIFSSSPEGAVKISNVPEGNYAAVIKSIHLGYRTVQCSLRIRSAEIEQSSDTLTIPKESAAWVPQKTVTVQTAASPPLKKQPPATPVKPKQKAAPEPAPKTTPAPSKSVSPTPKAASHKFIAQPPVVKAPADTFVGIFDSLTLTGTAKDNGSIVSMEWDIGAAGRFIQTENGTIHLPPFKAPVDRLVCLFRASDNDGESATDTMVVRVGLLWMSITPPKELLGRNGHSLVAFNDALWIIGGNRSDVWSSPDGISWTMMTNSAPFGNLFGHTTVVFNNKLWIIGGKTDPKTFSNAIWSSPAGVRWKREGTIPFAKRLYHGCVVHQGKLWITGGLSDNENEPILNDVWSSTDGRNWQSVNRNAPFSPRYGHGCAEFNNRIVVLGGFNDAVGRQSTYNDVWQSTDGTNWAPLTKNAPFSKEHFHSVLSFDNRLWAIGGYSKKNGTDQFTDILYTTDGSSWTDLTPHLKGGGRFFCTAVPLGHRILISPSDSHKLWIMR